MTDPYAQARDRWVVEPPKAADPPRGAFERDRARVLHSFALRRLAAKTQVVGVGPWNPDASDFPRTRLTHSLEVAQIGRELGAALGCDPDVVEAAGLAHDLGHPPFGHNGEAALDRCCAVAGGFEGNAQTLRVLTRLEPKVLTPEGRSAGLNLTRGVLDATAKYPWQRPAGGGKFGVYADDRPVFDWLRTGAPDRARCVEAQVMDWSDDVAYSVHDLEDGIHSGHVPLAAFADADTRAEVVAVAAAEYSDQGADALHEALDHLTASPWWPAGYDGSIRSMAAIKRLTSELTARFSLAAVSATVAAHGRRRLARYDGDLVVPAATRAECAVLKAVAALFVMRRHRELRAWQMDLVAGLVDDVLADAPRSLDRWLQEAWLAAPDDAQRLRVAVDQVASLTDHSAVARARAT